MILRRQNHAKTHLRGQGVFKLDLIKTIVIIRILVAFPHRFSGRRNGSMYEEIIC
ncbi:hypothetical protein BSM4216_1296 [Bacillus smithii]|nr:hypothetical protein BSM4216_1296 [Bacillus smithii]